MPICVFFSYYIVFRTYFEIIKCLGIRCFVNKCPFLKKKKKKKLFLIWIKSVKNNFQLKGIWFPPALLDYPSTLLSNKGALLLTWRVLFHKLLDSVPHFKLKFLNFPIFPLKYFCHIFCASVLWHMRHN